MTLVKTSILSFIATAIKMLAGLVINKAVARELSTKMDYTFSDNYILEG
ncbi:hypothetical protein P8S54_00530 [Thiomicrospira sp. R3]|nr:hypothetical protein [Thiomicrospira sp. R3]WFE68817.1 hypothetical protein P8S54_00530 [Thiomicrospira sp. R3]